MAEQPKIIHITEYITKHNYHNFIPYGNGVSSGSVGGFVPAKNTIELYHYEIKPEGIPDAFLPFVYESCRTLNAQDKNDVLAHEMQHWKNHQILCSAYGILNYYELFWFGHLDEISAICAPKIIKNKNADVLDMLNKAANKLALVQDVYLKIFTSLYEYNILVALQKNYSAEVMNLFQQRPIYTDNFKSIQRQIFTVQDICLLDRIKPEDKKTDTFKDYETSLYKMQKKSEVATQNLIKRMFTKSI